MPSNSLPDADFNLPEMKTKSPSCPSGRVHMYVLQTMNFDTNLIKISGELRKLWTIEYFNFGGMGATILNI